MATVFGDTYFGVLDGAVKRGFAILESWCMGDYQLTAISSRLFLAGAFDGAVCMFVFQAYYRDGLLGFQGRLDSWLYDGTIL